MTQVRLLTLDPGHFHAALVQKEMYPGVDRKVHVYAPLGPDLIAHLNRIAGFNARAEQPAAWELEVHTGPDYLERFLSEKPGNVVVLSGRNRVKIDYLEKALAAGLNVLADKPWIIGAADLPRLEKALDRADQDGLIAYDIMTERYEITSILQRALVQDAELFGDLDQGTPDRPGVVKESKHFLMKTVAGVPLRRPPWFFDVEQQGEGLTDVGTHLVDLVPWMLFPGQAIDHRKDIKVLGAKRWPTKIARTDFQRVTGESDFPAFLAEARKTGQLDYFCNTQVSYQLRGVHVKFDILWDFEAAQGSGDTHVSVVRGSRSSIEIHQGAEQKYRPELYVVPTKPGDKSAVAAALKQRVAALQGEFAGVAVADLGSRLQVTIPEVFRVGHEAHFGEVTRQFLKHLERPKDLPAWEKANMLAKYQVTTKGVELSKQ